MSFNSFLITQRRSLLLSVKTCYRLRNVCGTKKTCLQDFLEIWKRELPLCNEVRQDFNENRK